MNGSQLKYINLPVFVLILFLFLAFPVCTCRCYDNYTHTPDNQPALLEARQFFASDLILNKDPASALQMTTTRAFSTYKNAARLMFVLLICGIIFQGRKMSRADALFMFLACAGLLVCSIWIDDLKNYYFEYAGKRAYSNWQTIHTQPGEQWRIINRLIVIAGIANLFYVLFPQRFSNLMRFRRYRHVTEH